MSKVQTGPAEFELTDDYGNVHSYTVFKHGAKDGWRLALQLIRIIGRPLGLSLEGLTAMGVQKAMAQVGSAVSSLSSTEGETGISLGPVGAALSGLAMELLDHPEVMASLLQHAHRDNQELGKPGVFDLAYTANYGELIMAIGKIVMVNYGPFFSRGFGRSSTLLERLAKAQQTGTHQPSSMSSSAGG
jgi:hypothetical protein